MTFALHAIQNPGTGFNQIDHYIFLEHEEQSL